MVVVVVVVVVVVAEAVLLIAVRRSNGECCVGSMIWRAVFTRYYVSLHIILHRQSNVVSCVCARSIFRRCGI